MNPTTAAPTMTATVIDPKTYPFSIKPGQWCPSTHGAAGLPPMFCTKDGPVCCFCGTPVTLPKR